MLTHPIIKLSQVKDKEKFPWLQEKKEAKHK
jgi:hypothetical protein